MKTLYPISRDVLTNYKWINICVSIEDFLKPIGGLPPSWPFKVGPSEEQIKPILENVLICTRKIGMSKKATVIAKKIDELKVMLGNEPSDLSNRSRYSRSIRHKVKRYNDLTITRSKSVRFTEYKSIRITRSLTQDVCYKRRRSITPTRGIKCTELTTLSSKDKVCVKKYLLPERAMCRILCPICEKDDFGNAHHIIPKAIHRDLLPWMKGDYIFTDQTICICISCHDLLHKVHCHSFLAMYLHTPSDIKNDSSFKYYLKNIELRKDIVKSNVNIDLKIMNEVYKKYVKNTKTL